MAVMLHGIWMGFFVTFLWGWRLAGVMALTLAGFVLAVILVLAAPAGVALWSALVGATICAAMLAGASVGLVLAAMVRHIMKIPQRGSVWSLYLRRR